MKIFYAIIKAYLISFSSKLKNKFQNFTYLSKLNKNDLLLNINIAFIFDPNP